MTHEQWRKVEQRGTITPTPLDLKSGFMHLSGHDEVLETCERYFAPDSNPLACEISEESLGDALRWEPVASRGGIPFPHYYGAAISRDLIRRVFTLEALRPGAFHWGACLNLTASKASVDTR